MDNQAKSTKIQLMEELQKIPGFLVHEDQHRQDGFVTLHYLGREIGHFHGEKDLDLRLGKSLIKSQGLKQPKDSPYHPGRAASSHWIMLSLASSEDAQKVLQLVLLLVSAMSEEDNRE